MHELFHIVQPQRSLRCAMCGWREAFDQDELSAMVMLDLSAAFDVVDSEILLDKPRLY